MAVSKAQQRATAKYIKANYDRMEIVVPKGTRETIKNHAAAHGESVGSFIKRAVDRQMELDTAGTAPEAAGSPAEAGVVSFSRYPQSHAGGRRERRRDYTGVH